MSKKRQPAQPEAQPIGRVDILITEGVKRVVQNSKDPAILALYGKYGDAFNSAVSSFFGPIAGAK